MQLTSGKIPELSAGPSAHLLVTAIVVLFVSSFAIPLALKALLANNVLDLPNQRSLHAAPTPRGGGIALGFGFVAGLLVSGPYIWPLWLSTLGFALLGAWDDFKSRSASWRLILQIFIATISAIGVVVLLGQPLAFFALGAILLICSVNAVNFMDGINGITALNSIVWGGAYAALFWFVELPEYISLAAVLAFIGLAFLPWNLPTARVFLGDSGSYLVGGALGSLALLGLLAGVPFAALSPLAIYATDTGTALFKRARAGKKMTEAHSSHTFQLLVSSGWSHTRTAVTTASFTAITATLGLLTLGQSIQIHIIVFILIILSCCLYLWLPSLTKTGRSSTAKGD